MDVTRTLPFRPSSGLTDAAEEATLELGSGGGTDVWRSAGPRTGDEATWLESRAPRTGGSRSGPEPPSRSKPTAVMSLPSWEEIDEEETLPLPAAMFDAGVTLSADSDETEVADLRALVADAAANELKRRRPRRRSRGG